PPMAATARDSPSGGAGDVREVLGLDQQRGRTASSSGVAVLGSQRKRNATFNRRARRDRREYLRFFFAVSAVSAVSMDFFTRLSGPRGRRPRLAKLQMPEH